MRVGVSEEIELEASDALLLPHGDSHGGAAPFGGAPVEKSPLSFAMQF